jgi:hypothetical protein
MLHIRVLVLTVGIAGIPLMMSTIGGAAQVGPKGDPGGRILRELKTMLQAVPRYAHDLGIMAQEPHLASSCWTTTPGIQVDESFSLRESIKEVESSVGSGLRSMGWSHPTKSGPSQWYDDIGNHQVLSNNYIFRWRKRLPQGMVVGSTLQVGVPVTGWSAGMPLVWSLGSISPGIGEPNMHCGSG